MEFLRLYRGVADIFPSQMEDYHSAQYDAKYWNNISEENRIHTAGDGMYFALNLSDAEHYMNVRTKSRYGLVGKYIIKGDYKIFDDQNIDDSNMQKLHDLLDKIKEEIDKAFEVKMKKLNGRLFTELSEVELNEINKEENSLISLRDKIVKKIHEERLSYDLSIFQYQEVCVHNPSVKIFLESINIYFKSEQEARTVFNQIKNGVLDGDKILNIDATFCSKLDKILANLQQV